MNRHFTSDLKLARATAEVSCEENGVTTTMKQLATQEIESSWADKILNPYELEEFNAFQASLKANFTPNEISAFRTEWLDIVAEIEANLDKDPTGDFGLYIAERCEKRHNDKYGHQNGRLKSIIWKKRFKAGKSDVTPKVVDWLDKANKAYYCGRLYSLLENEKFCQPTQPSQEWQILMGDMSDNLKKEVIDEALADERLSAVMKKQLLDMVKNA